MTALGAISLRSTRQVMRSPQYLAPVLLLPTILLLAYAGGMASAKNLPGFPSGHNMFDYQLGGDMLLSALMAGVVGGITQLVDIHVKFLDRLLLAPTSRSFILLGRLTGIAALALVGCAYFTVVGLVFGARPSDVGSFAMMLLVQALAAAGYGSIAVGIALRTRKPHAVQILLPLSLALAMFSSAFLPADLLYRPLDTLAAYTPMSYIADALHAPWIGGLTADVAWKSLAAVAVLWVIGLALCLKPMTRGSLAGGRPAKTPAQRKAQR